MGQFENIKDLLTHIHIFNVERERERVSEDIYWFNFHRSFSLHTSNTNEWVLANRNTHIHTIYKHRPNTQTEKRINGLLNVRNGGCLGVNAVIKTFIVFRVVGGTLLLVVLFILLWLLYYYFYSPHDINRKHMTCSFMLKDFENVYFFCG